MNRIALAMLIGLLIALPATAQPAAVDRPTWAIGDTWTYRTGSTTTTWTVLGATEDGYVVQTKSTSPGSTPAIIHVTKDLLYDKAYWFHPQWPLAVGNQWTFTVQDTAVNGVSGANRYETIEKVVGQELVTVPAGAFQAIRIHGHMCNDTQGQCGEFDVWYAPKATYTVKIDYHWPRGSSWTRELVSYQVHTQ